MTGNAAGLRDRQKKSFRFLKGLIDSHYDFADRDQARNFSIQVTSLYKNWNYTAPDSPDYERYRSEISQLADTYRAPIAG